MSGPAAGERAPAAAPRSRRSRAELRDLLIEAGMAILMEEGLGTGAENLTFKRVFERVAATQGIRITNASVIGRVWQNQAEYQSAVLAAVAAEELDVLTIDAADVARRVVADADRSTLDGRRRALSELARRAGEADLQMIAASGSWVATVGVWALSSAAPRSDEDDVRTALRAGFAAIAEANLAFARTLQDDLGLRLRTGLELDHFVLSATALIKGCALRDRADPLALHGIMRPTGPDGAEQEWTILGVGLEALFDEYFELDPAWRPGP